MLIDWFTVGAQVLNFIILVWLMKRFLYHPILNAIDAREKKIADELARADKISREASEAKVSFDDKNRALLQQREQLLSEATDAAKSERQRLMAEARENAAALEAKQQRALQNKMQALQESVRNTARKEIFAIAEKALRDLAAVDIESQMVAVFAKQLRDMDEEQKSALHAAFALSTKQDPDSTHPEHPTSLIKVISSNALSAEQKNTITQTLNNFLGENNQLIFEQSPDLVGGIELSANGFKVGWSIAEYLHTLEAAVTDDITNHLDRARIEQQTLAISSSEETPKPEEKPKPETNVSNSTS
jgi:F-type H+-transporting ATPase subunit b